MHPEPRIVKVGSRELAVEDAGPDSGFPILMMNGAGSRHLFPRAVREGQEQGFRPIGYDRPGCGASTSLPGRRIADCAGDIRVIMSELGISRAAVWGSSGGEEPERARAEFRAQSAITLAERGSPDWWLQRWGDRAEQDAAHSREWAEYLALGIRDVLHAGDQGAFDDDGFWEDNSAFYYPWQFDLADIQAPVSLWHGLKDFIPITHARWLADRIPNITTHFPPEEDHTNIEENNRAAAFAWLKVSV